MSLGSPRAAAWVLFAGLLAAYHANGGFVPANGTKSNAYLPLELLHHGRLAFTPYDSPFMFVWAAATPSGGARVSFSRWDERLNGVSFAELAQTGRLALVSEKYYLVPSVKPGLYVNTFGPGAGLTALPLSFALDRLTGDLAASPRALWHGAKLVAAACVAASATLVFLTALAFTTRRRALALALAYGLGTCVFSVSSQALYQHGPTELFLALGTYWLVASTARPRQAGWAALAYGAAILCRPTMMVVAAAAGAHLLLSNRPAFRSYAAAALLVAVVIGAHNQHYLGSPLAFGQTAGAAAIARHKTGSPDVWQTPLVTGAAGLLASPSRGLFIFSPFLLFAAWGMVRAWRDARFDALRPLTVAVLGLWLVAFKWFDWWGGWSFGYRPLVDTAPLLAVLMVPVLDRIFTRPLPRRAFVVLAGWSVAVQLLGAFAYDPLGWNARDGRDIDQPVHRHRLWALGDSQLVYSATHLAAAHAARRAAIDDWLAHPND